MIEKSENSKENWLTIIDTIIKRQMKLIGKNLGLEKARKVNGIEMDDEGNVQDYTGDPEEIVKEVLKEYAVLTGDTTYHFAKLAISKLIKKDARIKMPKVLDEFESSLDNLEPFLIED